MWLFSDCIKRGPDWLNPIDLYGSELEQGFCMTQGRQDLTAMALAVPFRPMHVSYV